MIVNGFKPVENRRWRCAHRGPLLIHAGKTWGDDEEEAYRQLLQIAIDRRDVRRQEALSLSRGMLGGIVGVCRMHDCVPLEEWLAGGGEGFDGWQNWFVGPYGWLVGNAVAFSGVAPYRGIQGLFRVPRRVVARELEGTEYA